MFIGHSHPEVADLAVETVKPRWVGLDVDSWGLDHATWSGAGPPVPRGRSARRALATNGLRPLAYHLDLGGRLAPLCDEGVR